MKTELVTIATQEEGEAIFAEVSQPDEKGLADIEKTLVVMAHDIPFSDSLDHDNLYPYLRTVFDDHGYHTLLFDFASCGSSGGEEENLSIESARRNLREVLNWARGKGYEKFVLVGAGIAAALCLEETDKTTKMVFLFWPVVDLALYAPHLREILKIPSRKISPDFLRQMEVYDPRKAMKSLKVPVLIQYGARDDDRGMEQIERIKSGFNALRIDITSYMDGGHGLLDPRHRQMMGHHIRQFLHKYA